MSTFAIRSRDDPGNAAAMRAVANDRHIAVQRQLTLGQVDDPLEAEADAIADRVMRMPEPQLPSGRKNGASDVVHRRCAECEDEDVSVMRSPIARNVTPFSEAQRTENQPVREPLAQTIDATRGRGSGMEPATRTFMEARFGADFSAVRVHTDSNAIRMSRELNAEAFTVGNDIYFNAGRYSANSSGGQRLLAHELAHTLQQREAQPAHGTTLGTQESGHQPWRQHAAPVRRKDEPIQRAPVTDVGKGKAAEGKFDPLIGMYTVAANDTLTSIATRFGTTVDAIRKNNPDIKDVNKIAVGQKIFLPDLIMPLDPTGMKHSEMAYADYKKKWEAEKGRPITSWEETQLKKGCVGISAINTGMKPLQNLNDCYATFELALKSARARNAALRSAGDKTKKAVIFSMRFWSGGKSYAPDAATGKIDMSDYDSRLSSGDAWRPDDASGSDYINFDFGFYEVDTGMWWHANHKHDPGGMGPMKAYESSLDYYSKPLLDFDRQIFCVVAKTL